MDNSRLSIEYQIKSMIIEKLGLDISPEEISDDAPLFDLNDEGEGLDLDSVDALELVVGIKELFGFKPESADFTIYGNVGSIAKMVRKTIGK